MNDLNPTFKNENLRTLRRMLRLTQKEFIERYFSDENGLPMISIATLSNMEAKGGPRLNEVLFSVSDRLGMDSMIFSTPPEQFADQIRIFLPADSKEPLKSVQKRGNINALLNRLTMYFAEQLFDKRLKKGDKIESDRELAAKFDVGRSAIREALKVLDVLGMIDIRPGQGTYISDKEADFFIIPLSWSLFLNGYQVENILEVRDMMEVKAAYHAAQRQDTEGLTKLHEISHRIHTSYMEKDFKTFLDSDLDFHLCIAECSKNQVIYSMIQTISNLMRMVSGSGMVDEAQLDAIYSEHQKIYGLVIAGDAEGAADAMKEHLVMSKSRYNYR